MSATKESIEQLAVARGLTLDVQFVPFSKSPRRDEKHPSLNWNVSLLKNGDCVVTTPYSAGCGHCPSYQQNATVDDAEAVAWECENGKKCKKLHTVEWYLKSGTPILPSIADVLSCLISDGSAVDFSTFEEWAAELGYNSDSRKDEAIYRVCLQIGLSLRNKLGEALLQELRDALQDY
jgi:hypothetical protein